MEDGDVSLECERARPSCSGCGFQIDFGIGASAGLQISGAFVVERQALTTFCPHNIEQQFYSKIGFRLSGGGDANSVKVGEGRVEEGSRCARGGWSQVGGRGDVISPPSGRPKVIWGAFGGFSSQMTLTMLTASWCLKA